MDPSLDPLRYRRPRVCRPRARLFARVGLVLPVVILVVDGPEKGLDFVDMFIDKFPSRSSSSTSRAQDVDAMDSLDLFGVFASLPPSLLLKGCISFSRPVGCSKSTCCILHLEDAIGELSASSRSSG